MSKKIKFNSKSRNYAELSNMFDALFIADSPYGFHLFRTVEHYYQAHKATNKKDFALIRKARDGFEAKKLGKKIRIQKNWDRIKVSVMRRALVAKFTQDFASMSALLRSDKAKLIHSAPWDDFWGDGKDGKGKNKLGKMLMRLRKAMIKEIEVIVKEGLQSVKLTMEQVKIERQIEKNKKLLAEQEAKTEDKQPKWKTKSSIAETGKKHNEFF